MADGRLIIEIYEYADDASDTPSFEFIPCELSACLKRTNRATLKEIIQKGFDTLPKKDQDTEKRLTILRKLEEADIGKISVVFNPASARADASIELTNVRPVTLDYVDGRRNKKDDNTIILNGRYRLSEGNETTVLKDAQRLTLIYSSQSDDDTEGVEAADPADDVMKEICLNITYLEA